MKTNQDLTESVKLSNSLKDLNNEQHLSEIAIGKDSSQERSYLDDSTTPKAATDDRNQDDYDDLVPIEQNEEWRSKSKHVFILSEAGKPIYTL